MNVKRFRSLGWVLSCLILFLWNPLNASAQGNKSLYPTMAPMDQYLMSDQNAEIALARSAAPESVSSHATVMVLGRQGYVTAVKGTNGFACLVERAWMGGFGDANFWNPRIRGPICYNPAAVRTFLPLTFLRTKLALAGASQKEMMARLKSAYAGKKLPAMAPGAMAFMLSKEAYLSDQAITADGMHDLAHIMIYTPLMDKAEWGADMPKSPIYLLPAYNGKPEPINVYVVPTGVWSDGSPAAIN